MYVIVLSLSIGHKVSYISQTLLSDTIIPLTVRALDLEIMNKLLPAQLRCQLQTTVYVSLITLSSLATNICVSLLWMLPGLWSSWSKKRKNKEKKDNNNNNKNKKNLKKHFLISSSVLPDPSPPPLSLSLLSLSLYTTPCIYKHLLLTICN